ncbi:MAG TPA: hypothetical protein VJV79_13520 [Polyangiaceae bacterium]|nr:hypothetical protein [Polyangiaceae bacterium]
MELEFEIDFCPGAPCLSVMGTRVWYWVLVADNHRAQPPAGPDSTLD